MEIPEKIFISYSHLDEEFALRLASDLRSRSINFWIAKFDIRVSDDFNKAIQNALNTCTGFLIVLSPNAVASEIVNAEINYALQEKKKIFPVLLDKKSEIPFRLRIIQYSDFTTDYNAGFKHLLDAIKEHFPDAIEEPPKPPPPIKKSISRIIFQKVTRFIGKPLARIVLILLAVLLVAWLWCTFAPQMTRLNLEDFKSNMTGVTHPQIIRHQPIEFTWQAGELAFSLYRVGGSTSIFDEEPHRSPFKLERLDPDIYVLKTNIRGEPLEIYFEVVKAPWWLPCWLAIVGGFSRFTI